MMEHKSDDLTTGSGTDDGESNTPKENLDSALRDGPVKVNRVQRNTLERKRKEKIRMYIQQLKDMIPKDYVPSFKKTTSSNAVLEQAVEYMKHLKEQAEYFFNSNGTEVQRNEIDRLKNELVVISEQRDKYEKMVRQAAVVTPNVLTNASVGGLMEQALPGHTRVLPSHTSATDTAMPTTMTGNGTDKLPGQGKQGSPVLL